MLRRLLAATVICLVAALPPDAAAARWSWPLRATVGGHFRFSPAAPYAPGQRRGVDLDAAPGAGVRAVCSGRVRFTGALPRAGRALTVRCGALAATYLGLAMVAVHRGAFVHRGRLLGRLGAGGRLRLGARVAARRQGYVDPLLLLGPDGPAPIAPGPPVPASPRLRAVRPPAAPMLARPRHTAPPAGFPAAGWLGLGLLAPAAGAGAVIRARGARRERRAGREVVRARL